MKYFNDAILGNDEIVLSLNKKGKLLRLFSPSPHFRQFFKDVDIVFRINDNEIYVDDLDELEEIIWKILIIKEVS